MKSGGNAGISLSVASILTAWDAATAPFPSMVPSIKAQSLWAAPSLASNGALALTKSALTKIQLLEPAAFGRSDACDGYKSICHLRRVVIANHFFPSA